jgi:hypothetical protein
MKLRLRDYKTGEFISERPLSKGDVYELNSDGASWNLEYAEALYFINESDAKQGIIADDWNDDYTVPVNPYMTWELIPVYRTEDGYKFYALPDGTVVDDLNPANIDLSWDTFEDFLESTEGTAVEITE